MNLDLFNNLLDSVKENNIVQNFIKELSNYLEKINNELSDKKNNHTNNTSLKQENCLYQVVGMDVDGAYLQNVNNNFVAKENDISKDVFDKIGNDFVLRYQNGEYIIEEKLTQEFFDSLVGIKEYKEIQDNFIKGSNILEIAPNTRYKMELRKNDYCLLSYPNNDKDIIKVPKELIPFWARNGESLYYKDGKFNRDL